MSNVPLLICTRRVDETNWSPNKIKTIHNRSINVNKYENCLNITCIGIAIPTKDILYSLMLCMTNRHQGSTEGCIEGGHVPRTNLKRQYC